MTKWRSNSLIIVVPSVLSITLISKQHSITGTHLTRRHEDLVLSVPFDKSLISPSLVFYFSSIAEGSIYITELWEMTERTFSQWLAYIRCSVKGRSNTQASCLLVHSSSCIRTHFGLMRFETIPGHGEDLNLTQVFIYPKVPWGSYFLSLLCSLSSVFLPLWELPLLPPSFGMDRVGDGVARGAACSCSLFG